MKRYVRWMMAVVMACTVVTVAAAPRDGLQVQLSVPSPVLQGDVDVFVTVTVVNTSRQPVNLLKWQLPSEEVEGALFRITRDGLPVRYTGPLFKRTPPQAADHLRIDAGATLSYQVELTSAYDLAQNGRYAIEYLSRGAHGPNAAALQSEPLYLWLEGRSAKPLEPVAAKGGLPAGSTGKIVAYSSCTATQQTQLVAATTQAQSYADAAVVYLNGTPSATQRYTKWFGAYSSTGWNTAASHFLAVKDAFANRDISYDCKCKKTNTYAYVYPTQPYKIYLCGAFWSAPVLGTDSRGGTLIHEMTHFNVVASTDDWAYGQTSAASLALTNPTKALDNADSHEYFAENNPALP